MTGSLLQHLRRKGRPARAMKPFCSAGRGDVELLHRIQAGELKEDEINPYCFRAPVAPLVAAGGSGGRSNWARWRGGLIGRPGAAAGW